MSVETGVLIVYNGASEAMLDVFLTNPTLLSFDTDITLNIPDATYLDNDNKFIDAGASLIDIGDLFVTRFIPGVNVNAAKGPNVGIGLKNNVTIGDPSIPASLITFTAGMDISNVFLPLNSTYASVEPTPPVINIQTGVSKIDLGSLYSMGPKSYKSATILATSAGSYNYSFPAGAVNCTLTYYDIVGGGGGGTGGTGGWTAWFILYKGSDGASGGWGYGGVASPNYAIPAGGYINYYVGGGGAGGGGGGGGNVGGAAGGTGSNGGNSGVNIIVNGSVVKTYAISGGYGGSPSNNGGPSYINGNYYGVPGGGGGGGTGSGAGSPGGAAGSGAVYITVSWYG